MKKHMLKVSVLAVVAATFFLIGSAVAGKNGFSKTTNEDLNTAMHGEAFAYAKYMLYAEKARQSGREDLAKLFEESAKTERFEHLAEEAKLAGIVGSDAENLKDAIHGESYEVDTMYREFAEKAAASGDKAASELFSEIRNDEMKHRDAFKTALLQTDKTSSAGK